MMSIELAAVHAIKHLDMVSDHLVICGDQYWVVMVLDSRTCSLHIP